MTIETQGDHWTEGTGKAEIGPALAGHAKRLAGNALLCGVAASAVALATWNVGDPSFSVATDADPTNWLGAPGAMFSDLMMQVMGLGSLACLSIPVAWGLRLRLGEGPGPLMSWPSRIGWWVGGTFAASGAIGALPPTETWPLPTGLGGIAGDLVLRPVEQLASGPLEGWSSVVVAVPFAVLARIALGRAASLEQTPLDADEGSVGRLRAAAAVAVGSAAHWWYSVKGVAARFRTIIDDAKAIKREKMLEAQARAAAHPAPVADAARNGSEASAAAPAAIGAHVPAAFAEAASDAFLPAAPADVGAPGFAPPDRATAVDPLANDSAYRTEPVYETTPPAEAPIPPADAWHSTPIVAHAPDASAMAQADAQWDEERMRVHGLLPRNRATKPEERVDPSFAEPAPGSQPQAVAVQVAETQPQQSVPQLPATPLMADGLGMAFTTPYYAVQPGAATAVPQPAAPVAPIGEAAPRPTVRVQAQGQRVAQPPAPMPSAPQAPVMQPAATPASPLRPVAPTQAAIPTASSFAPADAVAQGTTEIREAPKGAPERFELPTLDYLREKGAAVQDPALSPEALRDNAAALESVLADFGVKGSIIDVKPGPVVTLYELEPAPGIKSSRVIGLAEDIARSMSAIAARVAVVPGRNAIGIELPNSTREMVMLREIFERPEFADSKQKLALSLGKTIGGEPVVADLAKMPHLLVAGTTGSGKSVAINTMILSLLFRMTPAECRLIMIDPKMLELSVYDGIPHLLSPVVTDPKKAVVALKWCVREMEERYKKMAKLGVRNVEGFNARVREAEGKGESLSRTVQTGFDRQTGEAIYETEELDLAPMPFIVVIIDEMADLMMVAGKDIEGAVQRLAQMARAAGIHVVMATQRPSVDVITGTIKANFPTRISFQVTSKIDSRTILGEQGAEQLLGMGDMLYMASGGRTQRVHGPFVSDEEVEEIVGYLKTQGVPDYLDEVLTDDEEEEADTPVADNGDATGMEASDDPYDQAVALVLRDGKASTSYVQRRLGIGYNRAASLIERMEQEGVISPANHAGKREILLQAEPEPMMDG